MNDRHDDQPSNRDIVKCITTSMMNREKVVFLFGAGASMPAGMPDARQLKGELFDEKFPFMQFDLRQKVGEEKLRKININPANLNSHTLDDYEFEQLMTLACEYFKDDDVIPRWIENKISDIYHFNPSENQFKFLPTVSYELLSHLMSQGLVKYAINFNYDELLDKALFDELGSDTFKKIVTKEDFEICALKIAQKHSLDDHDVPYLFKPHGTRSMRRTFRFRVDNVNEFEKDKREVLEHVLNNSTLVLVGYRSKDRDFINLIARPNLKHIVVVTPDDRDMNHGNWLLEQLDNTKIKHYKGTEEEFAKELAEVLSTKTEYRNYFVRPTRHLIRAEIYKRLYPNTGKRREAQKRIYNNDKLFFERLNLMIEVLIYFFKVSGVVTRKTLTTCVRIRCALDEYLQQAGQGMQANPLSLVLTELQEYGIIESAPRKPESLMDYVCYLPARLGSFESAAEMVVSFLEQNYLSKFVRAREEEILALKEELVHYFTLLQGDFDFDLTRDSSLMWVPLRKMEFLGTRHAFKDRTSTILDKYRAALRDGEKLTLRVMSSSAKWLYKELSGWPEDIRNLKVIVNGNLFGYPESLQYGFLKRDLEAFVKIVRGGVNAIKAVDNIKYGITMLTSDSDIGNRCTGKAILFYHEGKESSFFPFYTDDEKDLQMLRGIFDNLFKTHSPCLSGELPRRRQEDED